MYALSYQRREEPTNHTEALGRRDEFEVCDVDQRELEQQIEGLHQESFSWALGCCGHDRFLAEDVLQHVYVKVLSGRARFEERSSFKTWLFAVIRVTAHEHRRKSSRRLRLLDGWFQRDRNTSVTAEQDSILSARQEHERVRQALEQLSERQREVLELVFYHEMTIEEASEVLEMKLGTARTHYARGKKMMLRHLESDPAFEWGPA